MRPLARAAALAAVAALALPGCIVAIGNPDDLDEDQETKDEAHDAEAARHDARLLDLEKRMDRLEEDLPK